VLPDPLAGLRGPTSKGREGSGGERRGVEGSGREGEGKGKEGEGRRPHPFTPPNPYFWIRP